MLSTPQDILDFWFVEVGPERWYKQSNAFDALCRMRFGAVLYAAAAAELYAWRTGADGCDRRSSAEGRLAEIIVLDQFSRNIWRDTPLAFAQDAMALVLAQEMVALGLDTALPPERRAFAYLPYMHSESLAIHGVATTLFAADGLEGNADFEAKHKAIIDRFGRYPHRNAILGRQSTAAEITFLAEPGSSF